MAVLVEFETSKFNLTSEPENEFNQIFGHSILLWIVERCPEVTFEGTPETEDWGWRIDAIWDDRRYMIGASAEYDKPGVAWCVVQIEKRRSLKEKLFRLERLDESDGLVLQIADLFLNGSEFSKVECRLEIPNAVE